VYRLLGGEVGPLATYATGGYYRPGVPHSVYAEEMAGFVAQGYRAVKLKTGAGSPEDEAKRIAAVRKAIGDDPDLMLDMNAPYDQFDATRAAGFTEALRVAALAEQHGVMVAPHTAPELHGHLVLALPRCGWGVESHGGPDSDPLAFGLFHEHPQLRDGRLHLSE